MTLHPQAKSLLDALNAAPAPAPEDLTPAALREQYAALALPASVDGVDREDRTIPGPGGALGIRIYRPEGDEVTPVIVYFHGGGWVIGDLDTHDGGCAALCAASGCAVVAVDYRLAPEATFPAPVEDCLAATRWVADHAEEIRVDAGRLAVAGDSAGGNLAAVVAQIARDLGEPQIRFQLLVYPVTDYEFTSDSMVDNADGFLLTPDMMRWFFGHYLAGDVEAVSDPRVSPLRADDLTDLPPAHIITAGYDPLRDQGNAYAAALEAAGVEVDHIEYAGMFHGFFNLGSVLDTATEAVERAAAAIRREFGMV
jgi:acetyl esterase